MCFAYHDCKHNVYNHAHTVSVPESLLYSLISLYDIPSTEGMETGQEEIKDKMESVHVLSSKVIKQLTSFLETE